MTTNEPKEVVINNHIFYDVTNITTSEPIMNYDEAYAWTKGKIISTSG